MVLPTADAFEEPGQLVAAAMSWAERLGVEVDALMVLQRHDAEDPGAADVVRSAAAVYLVGDSSMHLRSALKDTPVLAALGDVLGGRSAGRRRRAVRGRRVRPDARPARRRVHARTRARPGLAVIPEAETWSEERLQRTLSLADTTVVELPTGSAVVGHDGAWELAGSPPPTVHGELAAVTSP